uniref:Uncharacterized protein n=1 Tax=Anguilla anguilla TaxID=7936 RepID=A0A0E9RZS6_ANGAN
MILVWVFLTTHVIFSPMALIYFKLKINS